MNFQLLVDSFRTSRSQITSVFLSSPRLCLYSIEIKKYQDSVRSCQICQGKQKKTTECYCLFGELLICILKIFRKVELQKSSPDTPTTSNVSSKLENHDEIRKIPIWADLKKMKKILCFRFFYTMIIYVPRYVKQCC